MQKVRVKRRKRKNREMKGGWQSNYFISEKGIEEKKRSKEENYYRKIEKRESKSKEKKRRLIEGQKRLE